LSSCFDAQLALAFTPRRRAELPVARATDPPTAHEAGRHATRPVKLRAAHAAVLTLYHMHGPMADHELIAKAKTSSLPAARQSDSGLRSRRKELVAAGKVRMARHSLTPSGRKTIVWEAVPLVAAT
jgi:hypothetical protein